MMDSSTTIAMMTLLSLRRRRQLRERRRRESFFAYILRRNKTTMMLISVLLMSTLNNQSVPRSIWSLPKSGHWWNTIVAHWGDEEYLENFRMTKATFDYILREVGPRILRQDTRFRRAIPPEHRLAITLWRLATNVEYRTLAGLFGVGRSTVGHIVIDTCQQIIIVFQERTIKIPTGQKLEECIARFAGKFPQAVGAIDGSHIPIKAPVKNPKDYHNRKGFHSIVLQGVVDSFGSFIDVYVGWPGRVHDARIFTNSAIYQKLINGTLFPERYTRRINGQDIPLLLLGDPAYPLLPNVIKPYSDNGRLTNEQHTFNFKLSSCRITVEHTFGRLKGRWRILHKTIDHDLKHVSSIVMTCCILHNIIELHNDPFRQQWEVEQNDIDLHENNQDQEPENVNRRNLPQAAAVRSALLEHLGH